MKKLIYTLPLFVFLFASCGGCDTSSAKGAGNCYCDLTDQIYDADLEGDDEWADELQEKGIKWESEVKTHIEAGDYSEEELEKAMDCNSVL